jgi:hypothetical protein
MIEIYVFLQLRYSVLVSGLLGLHELVCLDGGGFNVMATTMSIRSGQHVQFSDFVLFPEFNFFPFFFFFAVLRFELRAYTLSHSTSPFLWVFFSDRVSQTICPGWR